MNISNISPKTIKKLIELEAWISTEIVISKFSTFLLCKVTAPGFHKEMSFQDKDAIPAFLKNCLKELKNINLVKQIK